MRSLSHTSRGRLRSLRGYQREVRRLKRDLFTRDYDQPNEVDALTLIDDRDAHGKGDYWSTFRR